ncbi:Holliday junction resolvase RuvX [Thermoleophilia bacterium SCSIO 60948]|nr:Holliday junction resolvase RuvX [Thermoleophilia bacterium SCSIO 60948]
MKVLAVDHGRARSGCAICDPSETVVRPLEVVEPSDPRAIAAIAAREGAEEIVVGIPVSLDGAEREQARSARGFRDNLAGHCDVPVRTYDERLTTRMADASRREGATAAPDSLAASHLLESYLASRASDRSTEPVER